MPRTKGGIVTRRRHNKVLKQAKGYWGRKSKWFRPANQQVMKSLVYAYRDRRVKKREFRRLWITRINAACRLNDISYSRFINGLKQAGVQINRKVLSEMAINDAVVFASLAEVAKKNL